MFLCVVTTTQSIESMRTILSSYQSHNCSILSIIFSTKKSYLYTFLLYLPQTLLLLALLIPFANLFLLAYLGVVVCKYFNALKVFRKNQQRVADPFVKMKYDPEKCYQLKKDYYFMKIHFKSLRPQFNFKENTSLTESQGKQGNVSEWMIFNKDFESYYSDFPRWKVKFLTLMLTGIIETIGSTVLVFLMLI